MAKEQLVRQWEIIKLLNGSHRGMRSSELADRLECGRATIDRALDVLRSAGVPLAKDCVNGETRHRLSMKPLPPLAPTPLQMSALRLAVSALAGLEGTKVVDEIRALLREDTQVPIPAHLEVKVPRGRRDIVRTIENAIENGHRLVMVYRAAKNQGVQREYEVSPLSLRMVKEQLYLVGVCEGKQEPRVFKVARVQSAEYVRKPAIRLQNFELETWFQSSVKTWGGVGTRIEVRLRAEVAWLATEYPIVDNQTQTVEPDGAVRIRAEVAGLVEAKQWVLGWGSNAIALAPPELVEAVRAELSEALASYPSPGPRPLAGLAKAKGHSRDTTQSLNKLTG